MEDGRLARPQVFVAPASCRLSRGHLALGIAGEGPTKNPGNLEIDAKRTSKYCNPAARR